MLLLVLVLYAGRLLEHQFGYGLSISVTLKAGVKLPGWLWGGGGGGARGGGGGGGGGHNSCSSQSLCS